MNTRELHPSSTESTSSTSADILSNMPSFEEMRQAEQPHSPEDQAKYDNFRHLVKFFEQDAKVKQLLIDAVPDQDFAPAPYATPGQIYTTSDQDSATAYSDRLMSASQDISDILSQMSEGKYYEDDIKSACQRIETDIINAGADPAKLTATYRHDFTEMDAELVAKITAKTKSDSLHDTPLSLIGDAKSYNELLHVLHSSMMCDGDFFRSLPKLAESTDHDKITLYGIGTDNQVAQNIFNEFCQWPDNERDEDNETNIIGVNDHHVIMMVRGKGHSLSIDIEKGPDASWYVGYIIPKICNVDKVNQLPGVRKVVKKPGTDQAKESTSGTFRVTDKAALASIISDFVRAVPEDKDMEY